MGALTILQEDGKQLSSLCIYSWPEGTCLAAETLYECKKLGLSDSFMWNLLRAMLLIVGLTIGLPVALPWMQRQLVSMLDSLKPS